MSTGYHTLEHEELARKALDRGRLMEGEPPDSNDPDDFQHWILVYSELADFKRRMLADMRQSLPQVAPVAAAEIRSIDMAIIGQQLARYQERLAFWKGRWAQAGARTPA
jgi:hypothetical protein